MNITFKPLFNKKWALVGNTIIYGKKEISLSSLYLVDYNPVAGYFNIYLSEKYSESIMLAFNTFNENEKNNAKMVADYILKVVGDRVFFDITKHEDDKKPYIEYDFENKKKSVPVIPLIITAICIAIIILVIFVFSNLDGLSSSSDKKGSWGDDGYYNPTEEEMQDAMDEAKDWMEENW